MNTATIVCTPEYQSLLLVLDPDATFGFDANARAEFFRKYSLGDANHYPDFALIYKVMASAVFFVELSDGALVGVLQDAGKDFIVKVDQQNSLSVLGDNASNWVDQEYLNPREYNTAEFKRKCAERFAVPETTWDEVWPDLA